jgi:membrane associated rhomboid family serine protease
MSSRIHSHCNGGVEDFKSTVLYFRHSRYVPYSLYVSQVHPSQVLPCQQTCYLSSPWPGLPRLVSIILESTTSLRGNRKIRRRKLHLLLDTERILFGLLIASYCSVDPYWYARFARQTMPGQSSSNSGPPSRTSRRLCSCNAFVIVLSAPLTTGLALASLALLLLDQAHSGRFTEQMAIYPFKYLRAWWDLYRLFTYPLLHRNFSHCWANLSTLLLLGPPLEERYGSMHLGAVLAVTSVITGIIHASLFHNGLIGASGLVMCLLLLSASHAARFNELQRVYELPLSFLVLTVTYVTREVAAIGQDDGISRISHLLGVACGIAFALHLARRASAGAAQSDGRTPITRSTSSERY